MGSDKYLLSVYRTRIAHTERVAMSTNTKEVRRFALFISAITAISLALSGCSAPEAQIINQQPKTSQFVLDSFQDGQFLTPFEEGKPEMGLTLEAIANLSFLGTSTTDLQKAIDWAKSNTDLLTSPGLKGAYIFTANAAGFADDVTVATALDELKAAIADDGTVVDTNNFSYAWIIFGLVAANESELANTVAKKLITNAEVSGGYKYTLGDTQSFESADVTSFALMSIQSTLGFGTDEDNTAKEFSISKSGKWLADNLVKGTHYEAYENVDLGGTSYGIMALISNGQDATKVVDWLTARINKDDGGIPSPYSAGVSDVFTSVQALLPLSSLTFIDYINEINFRRNKNNS